MPHSFSLSLAAVDMLLEHDKLGRAPFPFQVPHIGTTHTQRAQVREAVFRDLESRGLMRAGRLDADVGLALRTFVSSPVAITAAAQLDDGKRLFARVVSDGQFAAVVKQDENLLVFAEARPTGLVPAIVDLLPLTPAAAGQSVTIAKSAPVKSRGRHAADGGYDPFAGVAPPRSQSSSQVRYVERIFEKPKLRIGQFTAFVRGQNGKASDLSPTAWFDTDDGRYFMTVRDSDDGQTWITYAPADNARIAQHLHSQLEGYL
ncbi:ESX secretion-associated protein EspG [Amycolatopsis antarctica]|uniref:ESX secretion-associated protein EspG n=1 Tax=Amycolatopsis antarctica TaxID=1854586 RepID=A0A263D469_9PSEU|nr:ESX secretion-associated protein EspG [Amycolatopsis antarctica]OZM73240.1 ESX secretion-associated protein EspG [Amycolatopsis antarctica]